VTPFNAFDQDRRRDLQHDQAVERGKLDDGEMGFLALSREGRGLRRRARRPDSLGGTSGNPFLDCRCRPTLDPFALDGAVDGCRFPFANGTPHGKHRD
jgi:hypothetical protein